MSKNPLQLPEMMEVSLILSHLQGGIVYSDFDPPFCLRYATDGLAEMTGYSQEELVTMKQMDIVWEEDQDFLAEDVGRQLSSGDTFDVEYRLKRKDGTYIYVLDRAKVVNHNDGKKYIHCLLTDITDLKKMEQALRLSEEKYRLAIQQSGNVILDYNLVDKTLTLSDNFVEVFEREVPDDLLTQEWISPEQQEDASRLFNRVLTSKTTESIEIQLCCDGKKPVWAKLTLTPVVFSDGTVHNIVGCLQNIDKQKLEVAHLLERSQEDGLTKVFNRVTLENMIEERLKNPDACLDNALVIIDVDYFKSVNDKLGHAEGDRILVAVAQAISSQLPENSIFGRLGGDEFVVFASAKDEKALKKLCSDVANSVKKIHTNDGNPITVSLGGTQTSPTLNNFRGLYRSADLALYETKRNGRDGFTVFNSPLQATL